MTLVRLEPAASLSPVKHSATALPISPTGVWLQMPGAHNLFCLYALVICDHCPPAKGKVEDFDFVSAVPHSNHHTMGTAKWQKP